jgi:hypothetical protein
MNRDLEQAIQVHLTKEDSESGEAAQKRAKATGCDHAAHDSTYGRQEDEDQEARAMETSIEGNAPAEPQPPHSRGTAKRQRRASSLFEPR